MWLEASIRLLREGRPGAALEAMLDAWRLRRVPVLADLIDTLSEALTVTLPKLQGRTRKGLQGVWLDVANERRDVDVGRLLMVFAEPPWSAVAQRIERLAPLDDPRVAKAFAAFLRELPTVDGIDSTRWTSLLSTLQRVGDVRARAALEARVGEPSSRVTVTEQLLPQARRVLESFPEDPTTTEDVEQLEALAEELVRVLQAPLPSPEVLLTDAARPRRPTREAELLHLICATPEDDGPRLVYGDWLQERGDPRAQLLLLQLKPDPSGRDDARARQLLRQYGRQWLGPLEPAIPQRTETFRRGFVAEGRVTFATPEQRKGLLGHPAWNTFTALSLADAIDGDFLEKTELRGLESLRSVPEVELGQIVKRAWPFRRLRTLGLSGEAVHALHLVQPAMFPSLKALELSVAGDTARVEATLKSNSQLLARLERIRLDRMQTTSVFVMLASFANLKQVTLTSFAPLAFHRREAGWVLELLPSPFQRRKGANVDRAMRQFIPLVVGVMEPSTDWGDDRLVARAALDAVRRDAGLEFVKHTG